MKSKKIFSSIFFVLTICLFFSIGAIAVEKKTGDKAEKERIGGKQLQAEKTRELISKTLVGRGSEVVGDANHLFLISLEKKIGIMKNTSADKDPDKVEYWYVSVGHTATDENAETVEAETGAVAVQAEDVLPEEFGLNQNFPNPFNPSTTINFQLPDKNGSGTIRTVLKIYDILGRLVRTVVDEDLSPGFYARQWDGLNDKGLRIGSGIYFYTLSAGDFREAKKMLVVK